MAAKAPTGILGLDEAMQGGLPRGRTTLVFGGPGCGKTVLALQSLVNGARLWNEPGIFVAFEEDTRRLIANASSFGWDLPELEKRKLFFLDATLRPDVVHVGKFDLNGILAGLAVKVRELGAKRIVLDGIDVLLTLLDDPVAERAELYRIQEWLLQNGLTGIITAKATGTEPFSQAQFGFAAYMADCALLLVRRHEGVVSERDISILKYRGSSFTENKSPYIIGPHGLEVAEESFERGATPVTRDRLSTGVARFDAMLKGGYFRASTALLTGLPGTAKSSLAGAFAHAACRRRERVLYVGFDERASEIVRNLTSIGIELQPYVDSGLLRLESALTLAGSAEGQLMRIRSMIREQRAKCVVIDPISALAKSSDAALAIGVLARFIRWAKVRGVTLVCTSLLSSPDPNLEATDLGVSTLCDTWVHLTYAQRGGERNRALTIVKSRGTEHSNQVRELVLSDRGITLADVYEAGGDVFMGTQRWEQENLRREEGQRAKTEARRRRLELEHARAELKARSEVLRNEVALNQVELEGAKRIESERVEREARRRVELVRHRGGADKDRFGDGRVGGAHRANRRTTARGPS